MDALHVDCESCVARGPACSDCVVSVLLGSEIHPDPGSGQVTSASSSATRVVDLDPDEQAALRTLANAGLVPPLRLVEGARPVRSVQVPLDRQDYA
jgi:hypothetical protein